VAPTLAPSPTAAPKQGGNLRIISSSAVTILGYPAEMSGPARSNSVVAIERLLEATPEGSPRAGLATEWKVSADLKTITLTLRKGVKFHDGTDFNAQVAKWNMTKAQEGKQEGTEAWDAIDIVDDYTLSIKLKKFQNTLLYYLVGIPGSQISPTAVEKNGLQYARFNPVGTGPFKFVSWEKDVNLKYERFDGYWGQKPYLDRLEYVFISDPTTRLIAFQRGDGEILQPQPKDVAELKAKGSIIIAPGPSALNTLTPDSGNPDSPFANKKVREALEYAVDRVNIAKTLGYGLWEPAYQVIPKDHPTGYDPTLKPREYNPTKAKQLLAEAGFPNGFKTTFILPQNQTSEAWVAAQTNLKEVGIDAPISYVTMASWTNSDLVGWKNGLLNQFMGADVNWRFHLVKFLSPETRRNFSMQKPAAMKDVFDPALAEPDYAKANELTKKIIGVAYEDMTILPLWSQKSIYITQPYVHDTGFLTSGHLFHFSPEKAWMSK
jgi:peptide/nickel transport system substrate-binding protein